MPIDFWRERRGERERKGVKHQSVTFWDWRLNLQPRYVPQLGIKPATFQFMG